MIVVILMFVISLIALPFVMHEYDRWTIVIYLCLCVVFTPFVGIPIYKILGGH